MTEQEFEHIHNLEHYQKEDKNRTKKLGLFIILLLILFVVELLGGYYYNSVALMSDALHVASDSFALIVAYVTLKIQQRVSKTNTFGYQRLEVLATMLNCFILLAASAYITYEAIEKLYNPQPMQSAAVLVVASIGLIINLIGLKLIHSHSHQSMVVKSAYLEALADTATSVGVIIGALMIYFFDILWIDSLIALAIATFIIYRVIELFKTSVAIIMQQTPPHINIDKLEKDFLSIAGVKSIHQLHIWDITQGQTSLSVHLVVENIDSLTQHSKILTDTEKMLQNSYQITHSTIQIELTNNHHNKH